MPSSYRSCLPNSRVVSGSFLFLVFLVATELMTATRLTAQSAATAMRPETSDQAANSQVITKLAGLPLGFEPNRGQMDPAVKYATKGSRYTLFLTSSEAVFALPERIEMPSSLKSIATQTTARQTSQASTWRAITMQFVGARSTTDFSATDRLPGEKNYHIGRDKAKWAAGVPLYSRVEAHDIYPGIDVAFRGIEQQLEFDFLVSPGANAKRIALGFSGARHIKIDPAGDLVVSSAAGDLQFRRPVAYQDMPDGTRKPVRARFAQGRNNSVRLAFGSYDRRRQLVIDPSVTYATYLGGTNLDEGLGIAVSSDNIYVTGATASPNFPDTGQLEYTGGLDVFVTEFNSSGQLVFSTLVGGSEDDVGTSIALSPNGILVTGYTKSSDFPAFYNYCYAQEPRCEATQLLTLCGIQNAFVFALTPLGAFNPATTAYVGGSDSDTGLAIASDNQVFGYFYVAGQTTSSDFFSCSPLFNESQINMGHGSGPSDAWILKLSQSFATGGGPAAYFSTFLGGSDQDFATGIALDNPDGTETNIYVTGGTVSPDFYTTPGVIQPTCGTDGNCNNGNDDVFVTVLCTDAQAPCNAVGSTPNYVYSTFLGGSGKDDAYSIAADINGHAYITGQTSSPDFKLQNPFQGTLKGSQNAFVSKLNPGGTALVFSTYLGGNQSDAGLGLAIDNQTNVYITGRTNSPDFPLQLPTQPALGGGTDAFVSVLNASGNALNFSTFFGGSGDEDVLGGSIAVDSLQNVYITGDTNSTNLPTQNPYQGTIGSTENCTINGNQVLCPDAFVATFNTQPSNEATLTVTVSGPGTSEQNDTVSSSPPGIACSDSPNNPGICVANFVLGTMVTLTATPDGSQFAGWGGNAASCGISLTCQIQINGTMSVTATFAQLGIVYTLMVSGQSVTGVVPGTGVITSNPAGIDCGDQGDVCSFDFAGGTRVTLTPIPDPGSYFYGWSANPACAGTGPCVLILNSNQTVDYTWASNSAPPLPDFTITISPQSLGTVPVGSQGVAGIAIATVNGFNDTVNMTCSVLPASASSPSCAISPSSLSIPLNGAGSATLTVNTTGLMAVRSRHTAGPALGLFFPFLAVLYGAGAKSRSFRGRRNSLRLLLFAILVGIVSFAIACGSSGGGGSTGGVAQPGTYTVTVEAQAATTPVEHSAQVTVTVQ